MNERTDEYIKSIGNVGFLGEEEAYFKITI